MTVITDWTEDKAARFGSAELGFRHALHERPMFDNDGLASVLDRYPRDKLGVFTMGEDPVDWRSWRRGTPGALSGEKLLEAVQAGRIWLNLRAVNDHLPEYAALSDEIFADKAAHVPGLRTMKRDVGLLISSADAQVFYHFDSALVSLWQLRGRKTAYIYPPEAPFVRPDQIEALVLKEAAEQVAFNPTWDAFATVFEMEPGVMVTWRQNAPHRITNGPMMNVSLSIEFMTPRALLRANVLYANGLMRRRLGANPRLQSGWTPGALGKFALARAAKAVTREAPGKAPLPPSFRLHDARPGELLPLS